MWEPYEVNEQIKISSMYSMFESYYPKVYSFPGESHNFWECVYIMKGSLCVSGDDRIYNMNSGEIVFHKPLEVHKFKVNDENGAQLFIFSFSLEGALADFFRNKVFKLTPEQTEIMTSFISFLHKKNPITPNDSSSSVVFKYLEGFSKSPAYSQMVVTYLYRLFLSFYDDSTETFVSATPDALIFSRAVNYMNAHISSKAGIDEIARYCNISPTGLKRIFYRYSGLGIHKYFVKMKINTAIKLLKNGDSVSEVSEKLGFASQPYFSCAFKRETGYPPSCAKSIQ